MAENRDLIGGMVLAAGAGRRFGSTKQLAQIEERPMLDYSIAALSGTPSVSKAVVVLGAEAEEIRDTVDFQHTRPIICPSWSDGISASLRCGLAALAGVDIAVILLGDQPGVTSEVIEVVLGSLGPADMGARALFSGRPGHPVAIRRELFPALTRLSGDIGARLVLDATEVQEVECGRLCSGSDVDTPKDLPKARVRANLKFQRAD